MKHLGHCFSGNWPPTGVCWYLIQCSLTPWLGFLEAARQGQGKSPSFFQSAGPSGAPHVGFRSSYRHKSVASFSSSRALHITNLCPHQWLNTDSASHRLPSAPKCTFKNSHWVVVASMYSELQQGWKCQCFPVKPLRQTTLRSPEFPSGISEPRNSPHLEGPL